MARRRAAVMGCGRDPPLAGHATAGCTGSAVARAPRTRVNDSALVAAHDEAAAVGDGVRHADRLDPGARRERGGRPCWVLSCGSGYLLKVLTQP
jgi:hypothetical protein